MWQTTAWLFTFTALNLSPTAEPERTVAPTFAAADQKTAQKAGDKKLDDVLGALQKAYEGTGDFQAKYTQKFTYTLLRRTQTSEGTVRFKKPGLMRWDYKKPTAKSFIVDGKKLWVSQPEDKNVLVDHCFKQDGLTASVSFLWGSGQITEQFDAAWFDGVFGDKKHHHIQLTPKKPNGIFAKLILVVHPKTYRVQQSVVVDPQGNVNQFLYEELKFNKGLDANDFAFTPPDGLPVSRIPGSCDPAAKD